ncbi:DUF5919 domain-containing protein [Plantactinospora soyae]|uniref:DNA-binding transcriptional regulator YiaG n=1 Tax=Plantactinospora soyae TaxID=1544732 RepID=A0A927M4F8_9ACTN|nr:DUF5919 domain-containing protein [Plantactinospora soyae]MBE1486762.1 DNA-binding transcriptional regulator YiaG [Plantactinospora soyae]
MTTVQRWTGRETRALRHALRMSIRDFAEHLGVSERTVSKWEAGQVGVYPRPEMQAALDTSLAQAEGDARSRFSSILGASESTVPATDCDEGSDLATIARRQVTQARTGLGLTPEQFAEALGQALRWKPTAEMISSWETATVPPGDVLLGANRLLDGQREVTAEQCQEVRGSVPTEHLAGVTAVYRTRAELSTHLPCENLLSGAQQVRAVGLSLNLLCQHYADRRWRELIETGTHARCLFLDPDGSAVKVREAEEGFPEGHLAALTKLNIETLLRVRDRLPDGLKGQLGVATYNQTIRFNIVIVDDLCIAQPYLPDSRGVDAPAFVIRQGESPEGLYPVFEQVFDSQWEQGRQL